jgi:methionine-rich copper-binding protein CopC
MHKLALAAVAAAMSMLAAPAAFAQMSVTSDDIKDGAVGTKAMEANVFGCDGGTCPRP